MSKELHVAIVTPEKDILDVDCEQVQVPSIDGEIGLMPGHIPLVTALNPGVLTVIDGRETQHYAIGAGFAEILDNRLTVLTEACDAAKDIDVDKARLALHEAETKLQKLGESDAEFVELQATLLRNRARIDAAGR